MIPEGYGIHELDCRRRPGPGGGLPPQPGTPGAVGADPRRELLHRRGPDGRGGRPARRSRPRPRGGVAADPRRPGGRSAQPQQPGARGAAQRERRLLGRRRAPGPRAGHRRRGVRVRAGAGPRAAPGGGRHAAPTTPPRSGSWSGAASSTTGPRDATCSSAERGRTTGSTSGSCTTNRSDPSERGKTSGGRRGAGSVPAARSGILRHVGPTLPLEPRCVTDLDVPQVAGTTSGARARRRRGRHRPLADRQGPREAVLAAAAQRRRPDRAARRAAVPRAGREADVVPGHDGLGGHRRAEARAVLADQQATATTSGRSWASAARPPTATSAGWASPTRPTTPGCGGC